MMNGATLDRPPARLALKYVARDLKIGELDDIRAGIRHASPMDEFDRALLSEVQRDSARTYAALGEAVNLSESAVRRRLARLRADRVIEREVALVDPGKLGVSVIIEVRMKDETPASYARFKKSMIARPEVSQVYTVSGEVDFMVIAHMTDLATYDRWLNAVLIADDSLQRTDTMIVYSRVKFDPAVTPYGTE